MKFRYRRIPILFYAAFCFAAFLATAALLAPTTRASANSALPQAATVTPTPPDPSDCGACHPEKQQEWYGGAHSAARTSHVLDQAENCVACHPEMIGGQATPSNAPVATQTESIAGRSNNCIMCHTTGYDANTNKSKAYGITCEACHSPIVKNHPEKDMPINQGTDMCARCHSDSRFNWSEWKGSKHYQQEMRCVECHDPHTTGLRFVAADATANKSVLCLKCHEETSEMSPSSVHGRAGVTCEQCHLGVKLATDAFHIVPNHSFSVKVETCNGCHASQIHRPQKPGEDVPAAVNINPSPTPYAVEPATEEKPDDNAQSQNQNLNLLLILALLAGLTGIIGLLIGILFSSKFTKLLRK
ncbi:MAG: multiheme c-type cytochrome [Anaerolineales bacterium]|nr:multiheme c-type cytochrome [Anaerolineales bacterium]